MAAKVTNNRIVKFAKEQMTELLDCLRLGMSRVGACHSAKIDPKYFYERLKHDGKFKNEIEHSESQLEKALIAVIRLHSKKQWTAASWLLQHKWPERYFSDKPTEMGDVILTLRDKANELNAIMGLKEIKIGGNGYLPAVQQFEVQRDAV